MIFVTRVLVSKPLQKIFFFKLPPYIAPNPRQEKNQQKYRLPKDIKLYLVSVWDKEYMISVSKTNQFVFGQDFVA